MSFHYPINGGSGPGGGVTSLNTLTGAVTISAGSNITLTPSGNDIEISATGGGGSPAGSDTQIQYNNAGAFGADSGFTRDGATGDTTILKTTGTETIGYKVIDNLYSTFTGSGTTYLNTTTDTFGLSGLLMNGGNPVYQTLIQYGSGGADGFASVAASNEGIAHIASEGVTSLDTSVELSGSLADKLLGLTLAAGGYNNTLQLGDGTLIVGLPHTTQSAVSFTGSGLDDLTVAGLFTGTVPTTYTVTVASTGTPDTFDWTDGTNTGTGVSMSTSPISLSNGISISFGADTGHTLSDSWTWTYSTVNQNVLDFSNNDYKFQSTFGTDTFGYQIGDNILGYGLKGSVNTYTNTAGDFGYIGLLTQGGSPGLGNVINFSTGESVALALQNNGLFIDVHDSTSDSYSQSASSTTFALKNTISGIEHGISQSAGAVTIGNISGGNNTKISIDDVNEHITISNLPAYDDDTAAGVGGLTAGMVYMTTGSGSAPLNAAGILMIKQ